jgi:hypothetical protein
MARVRRRRLFPWLAVLAVALTAAPPWGVEAQRRGDGQDAVGRLVDALGSARNFKVRVHAATLLARLKDPRSLPALVWAAGQDPHPVVRATAVRLLAKVARGDLAAAQQARPAIGRALSDREAIVRRQASASLAELDRSFPTAPRPVARAPGGATVVAVGSVGDRTGRAPRALRERMRSQMVALLQREPRIQLAAVTAPGVAFLIDGTIARLSVGPSARDVEAVCAVEMVVSRPPRGIVTVASGEAIVQRPRTQYHPSFAESMQAEALDNAVKSAHESLAQFLKGQ